MSNESHRMRESVPEGGEDGEVAGWDHEPTDEFPGEAIQREQSSLPEPESELQTIPNQETIRAIDEGRRRSTRTTKSLSRYEREGMWVSMEAKLELEFPYHVAFKTCIEINEREGEDHPMLAYAATSDPDTMYFHQAMKEPDRDEFIKAMRTEVQSHTENGVWEVVLASTVPEGVEPLPAVWAMKRKRRIATREVYKWKARLNIDGSKQKRDRKSTRLNSSHVD